MSRNPKVSQMTEAVLMARRRYPQVLAGVVAKLNSPAPYMQEKISREEADKRLLMMTEDDMVNLARTDPMAAERAAARIYELQTKAPPLPPGQGEWEE